MINANEINNIQISCWAYAVFGHFGNFGQCEVKSMGAHMCHEIINQSINQLSNRLKTGG